MRFRVLIFTPAFLVVRRLTLDSTDEFTVEEDVRFLMDEKGWMDPEAHLDIKVLDG